jgi:iron complex outermembrane receptor protein
MATKLAHFLKEKKEHSLPMRYFCSSRSLLIVSIALCLACLSPMALAQGPNNNQPDNPLKKLTLEQLGNVEVTSVTKEPEQVWETPAAIFVLTNEDIRRAGVTNILDALRLVPGVDMSRNDSSGYSVGIRGFETVFSKGLLVMIDGRSLYNTLFGGVYQDLPDYPLEDIDRIEVIRGPGATVWGSNAVNGVINIITKPGKDTQGLLVSAGGGNVDEFRNTVRYGGTRGKMTYRLYEESFSIAPEFHFGQGQSNYDDMWTTRGGFRTDWKPGGHDAVTFQGDMFASREGEQTGIAIFNPPSEINPIFRDRVSGGNLLLHWTHTLTDKSDFKVQTYFDRVDRDRPQFGEKRDTFDIDVIYHTARGRWSDLLLGAGVRVNPDKISTHFPGSVDFTPANRTDVLYSGFIQDEIKLLSKVSLTVGVKLEHNDFSGFEWQPTGRILYRPREHQSFWAAVTRAVQTPDRLDQDINIASFASAVPPIFLRLIGQKAYDAERAVDYEGGYRQLLSSTFYFDLAVFHNSYHGLENIGNATVALEADPPPAHEVLDLFFLNGAAGTTDGVEVSPNWKIRPWLQLAGSYSYLTMDFRSTIGAIGESVALNLNHSGPHHRVVITPRIDMPGGFEFDPTYRYEGATAPDANNPTAAYHTLDLRLGHRVKDRLALSIVGQNLLQPHHIEGSSNPAIGIRRGVFAKLTWQQKPQ